MGIIWRISGVNVWKKIVDTVSSLIKPALSIRSQFYTEEAESYRWDCSERVYFLMCKLSYISLGPASTAGNTCWPQNKRLVAKLILRSKIVLLRFRHCSPVSGSCTLYRYAETHNQNNYNEYNCVFRIAVGVIRKCVIVGILEEIVHRGELLIS